MKIPWLLYCVGFAVVSFGLHHFVCAVVVWLSFRKRRSLIPESRLLHPEDLKEVHRG